MGNISCGPDCGLAARGCGMRLARLRCPLGLTGSRSCARDSIASIAGPMTSWATHSAASCRIDIYEIKAPAPPARGLVLKLVRFCLTAHLFERMFAERNLGG